MKHTPKPWRFWKQRDHRGCGWQWVLDSPTRSGMAIMEVPDLSEWAIKNTPHVVAEQEETIQEVEANALLIAAAPDLFDACVLAADSLFGYVDGGVKISQAAYDILCVAVAKATAA